MQEAALGRYDLYDTTGIASRTAEPTLQSAEEASASTVGEDVTILIYSSFKISVKHTKKE